jgi:peptide/nickel transport system ATP-binding protein
MIWLHLVSVAIALGFWKRVSRDARAEGMSWVWSWAWLVLFGIPGVYGFSVHREALVRDMKGARAWGITALLVVLAVEMLPFVGGAAGIGAWGSIGLGLGLWLVFHLVFSSRRPTLTVDRVLDRAARRGRRVSGDTPLLVVRGLAKYFPVHRGLRQRRVGAVRAVDGIDLEIKEGETLSLVGESGSGKTTTGRLVLRLLEPTGGSIRYRGVDLRDLTSSEMRALRKEIQIIFQDPYSSLNPRLTVEAMLKEALAIHKLASGKAADRRVEELLEMVGLSGYHARRYPHEFSGGQRQRLGIARALAVEPRLIVCDEPVSALDVSVQAQIVNLLKDLQERLQLAYLFIAHDLNVVAHLSDRVAVMYLGRIVELADRDALYAAPRHPYTRSLLAAVPVADPEIARERVVLRGDMPSAMKPPSGCPFHPRCPEARPECSSQEERLIEIDPGHWVACHRAGDLAAWRPVFERSHGG